MTDTQTMHALRRLALTRAWRDDPCDDVRIDKFRLLRRHNQMPQAALVLLQNMADDMLPAPRSALYQGAQVNHSEQQAALHMALRAADPAQFLPAATAADVVAARTRMLQIAARLHQGRSEHGDRITDILHIGIGGSDLSPRLLQSLSATATATQCPNVHFLSGPCLHWPALRSKLNPATTQVMVVSKSLGTTETLYNWRLLRDWQQQPELVITAATDKALEMGIQPQQIIPLWPWLGGRYSFASAVSLSAAAVMGTTNFNALLAGAESMDRHFFQQPAARNLPVQLALLDFWNHCIRRFPARGVFTYHPSLSLFSNWLQQLEMESNGKRVDQTGQRLSLPAAPLLFGGDGPQAQHAMFQLLHQGERDWPLELIGVLPAAEDSGMQLLLAQMLAQWETLAQGDATADPVRQLPGARPVSGILLSDLSAHTLGAFLAACEHKTFTFASLIGCNPFDQWGVEAGKRCTRRISAALACAESTDDQHATALSQSMQDILAWIQRDD